MTARPLAGSAGSWIGAFGWLIGFALVTWPHTPRFALPIAGGVALGAAWVLGFDRALRHARRPGPALYGALLAGVALLGGYWECVVEPAVRAQPDVAAQMLAHGASAEFPVALALAAGALALPLLLVGFWPTRRSRARARRLSRSA